MNVEFKYTIRFGFRDCVHTILRDTTILGALCEDYVDQGNLKEELEAIAE